MLAMPRPVARKQAPTPIKDQDSSGSEKDDSVVSDPDDAEVEDEDFSWYDDTKLRDSTYIVLVNCDRRTLKKGE